MKATKFDHAYLEMAIQWGKLSSCKRNQVGCLIVKDNQIISDGYNGTPSGHDNECEEYPDYDSIIPVTKWSVLHAETNAIAKLAKLGGIGAEGSTLYIKLSPCKECSKLIYQSGIKRVVWSETYRNTDGLEFLKECGIELLNINKE